MRSFFVLLAAVGLSTVAFAGGSRAESGWWEPPDDRSAAAPQEGDKSPLMVSLTEMKWVDLPERKGMQYALITGDPKTGPYTQMRKVPAGTDNP